MNVRIYGHTCLSNSDRIQEENRRIYATAQLESVRSQSSLEQGGHGGTLIILTEHQSSREIL